MTSALTLVCVCANYAFVKKKKKSKENGMAACFLAVRIAGPKLRTPVKSSVNLVDWSHEAWRLQYNAFGCLLHRLRDPGNTILSWFHLLSYCWMDGFWSSCFQSVGEQFCGWNIIYKRKNSGLKKFILFVFLPPGQPLKKKKNMNFVTYKMCCYWLMGRTSWAKVSVTF